MWLQTFNCALHHRRCRDPTFSWQNRTVRQTSESFLGLSVFVIFDQTHYSIFGVFMRISQVLTTVVPFLFMPDEFSAISESVFLKKKKTILLCLGFNSSKFGLYIIFCTNTTYIFNFTFFFINFWVSLTLSRFKNVHAVINVVMSLLIFWRLLL